MAEEKTAYRVLARKYRPGVFKDLIGQDALVQTLSNAIKQNRIAHAFILTGIRGVGKTSTARIIAKALNCVGKDGKGGITAAPCGECNHCVAITESRHVDVLEMDAASRTGVGDVREIIENINYMPTSARYKIFIIDEVHMLSKNAFNALLKTLEEPPEQVIFIFATTEIRKIPVTILSRCQRFDLPRVDMELLSSHLRNIAEKEGVKIDDAALYQIANAAEGSVRDALSLLDQAIAHSNNQGSVELEQVQKMLGLVGRDNVYKLFKNIVSGDVKQSITGLREMYNAGADPLVILQDMLELSHFITQAKIMPELSATAHTPESEVKMAHELADSLSFPYLARCWQMLLKGVGEVQQAPNALIAAEMVIIRLTYVADVPPPGELIKNMEEKAENTAQAREITESHREKAPEPVAQKDITSFSQLVDMFKGNEEYPFLHHQLKNDVYLVDFRPPKLEIRLSDAAPKDLPGRISGCLREWTGKKWMVILSNENGQKTLNEKEQDIGENKKKAALEDELVKDILKEFSGSKVSKIEEKPKVINKAVAEQDKVKTGEQS